MCATLEDWGVHITTLDRKRVKTQARGTALVRHMMGTDSRLRGLDAGSEHATARARIGVIMRVSGVPTWARAAAAAVAFLAPISVSGQAWAGGDVAEIFRGRAGAYEISLGVLPEEPALGRVHFSVTVSDAESSQPIADAEVVLVAVDEHGREEYQSRALNTPDDPLCYDANITFESAGHWTIVVKVDSAGAGKGSVDVPLEVSDPALTPGPAGTVLFVVVLAVLTGGGLYLWRSSRRALRSRDEA